MQRQPHARLVAGATDVGVQVNHGAALPQAIVDLHHIHELRTLRITDDEVIAGALTTWTDLEAACRQHLPEFYRIVCLFGSPQIRNMGTLGGNIANGSPIADSLPFLYVMESELDLVSSTTSRTVNINDFFSGYKQCDLQPSEMIARVRIPLPDQREVLRLFKVSRRRDLDISTFTAALRLRMEGQRIARAAIALGGVGPNIIRARRTEAFLVDEALTLETASAAGDLAVSEITPISDVRGSADYRRQLTRNIFLRLYYEHHAESGTVGLAPGG
jgi:xanthine dehydrogenase small subunit